MSAQDTNGSSNDDNHLHRANLLLGDFCASNELLHSTPPSTVESKSVPTLCLRTDQIFLGVFYKKDDCSVSEADMKKIEAIIWFALWKFEEVRMNTHDEAGIELFYERHHSDEAPVPSDDTNIIHIYITNDFQKLTTFATNRAIVLRIPQSIVDQLVDSQETFTDSAWTAYNNICAHIVHEMAHLYGAKHAHAGLMSGVVPLFENNKTDFKLWEVIDELSVKIIAEKFSREKSSDSKVLVTYDASTSRLTFNSPIEIVNVVFIRGTAYGRAFHVFTDKFVCTTPARNEWDSVMVCLVYGQQSYWTQQSAIKSKLADKVVNF